MRTITFNLQQFADTITSSSEGKFEFGFVDGDTRIYNLPNPRTDITSSEVAEIDTWMSTNQPIIGDKSGSSSTGINSLILVEKTTDKLDISQ